MSAMKKYLEVSEPTSCLSRAEPDEPVFVLLARDIVAPAAIEYWVFHRCANGKNNPGDAQIIEALTLAGQMRNWRRQKLLEREADRIANQQGDKP